MCIRLTLIRVSVRGSTVFERRKQINYIYLPPRVISFYYYLFFYIIHSPLPQSTKLVVDLTTKVFLAIVDKTLIS